MAQQPNIAVYGGAFDPPHLAHVFTVSYLLSRADIDEVWLLPTAAHVFGKEMRPFAQRVDMLNVLINHLGWDESVKVSSVEEKRDGPSRTFDTLNALSDANPNSNFVWVMGADNLTERHR